MRRFRLAATLAICLMLALTLRHAGAQAPHPFDGDYYSHEFRYGFRIHAGVGVATVTNSPRYKVGEIILRYTIVGDGQEFVGEQICTDGNFYPVTGKRLASGSLSMTIQAFLGCGGVATVWTMTRAGAPPGPVQQVPPATPGKRLILP